MDAFGGQPVWLASFSRRDRSGQIIATGNWKKKHIDLGLGRLRRVLDGVGDPERERLFRMNITLCLHRGVTTTEEAALPSSWHERLGGMAGGPIQLLWSHGVPDHVAGRPCIAPGHDLCIPQRPDLWLPVDCGQCDPCKARAEIASR